MNSPVRPSGYFTGGIAPSAPSGILATVPNPPPDIARLPAGTTLRGVVVGEDAKGQALIKTDLGTLAVATKAHLPKDSEVVLQLRSSGAHLHIMVMQARTQGLPQNPIPAAPPPLSSAPAPAAPAPGQPQGPALDPTGSGHQGATSGRAAIPLPATPGAGAFPHGAGFADLLTLGQTVRATVQTPAHSPASTLLAAQAGAAAAGVGADAVPDALTRLASGTVLTLRILSVSGPQSGPGTGPGTGPGAAPGQAASAAGPNTAGIGGNPQISPAPAPQGSPSAVPAGTASGAPAPASVPGGAPGASTGASPGTSMGVPAAIPTAGAPGAATAVTVPAPMIPGADAAAATGRAVQSGQSGILTFNGQVVGATHAGHPVLTTPLGTLILDLEARLPGGSQLALELAPSGLPKEAGAAARPSMPGSLAYAWPALQEALALLSDPTGAAGAARPDLPGVPQPGPRLTSGILFFLAALGAGNLGRWLGAETVQTLRSRGGDSLLGRMSRDLGQIGRMAEGAGGGTGATGGDWRLLPIPLWDGDHLHQLRLYLRQHHKRRDEAEDRERREATRFILELELTRMGEMQLDGLVRDRRFDLVMRTRDALPEAMRQDIRQIFEDANAAAGYAGTLGFQASSGWHFLPAETAQEPGGLVV